MSHREHQQQAQATIRDPIRCGVITISDSRTRETDTSGAAIHEALRAAGHDVVEYELVSDEQALIIATVKRFAAQNCQVIITNGGTGISQRDGTFEAITGLLEQAIPGFGELFRMLSYQEIGSAAMLSRATAGLYAGAVIFALPGSRGAVQLALQKLIIPELEHVIWERRR